MIGRLDDSRMAVRAEKCVHASYKSINQALSVASAEDAKNCEESDMELPADRLEALRENAPPALGN